MEPIGRFERNANGGLVGDLTAAKARVSAKWHFLDAVEYQALLDAAAAYVAAVCYMTADGGTRTESMTIAIRDGALKLHDDGRIRWGGVSVECVAC